MNVCVCVEGGFLVFGEGPRLSLRKVLIFYILEVSLSIYIYIAI